MTTEKGGWPKGRQRNPEKTKRVLDFIRQYFWENGVSPTGTRVAQQFGIHPSIIHRQLTTLESMGYIKRVRQGPRSGIIVILPKDDPDITRVGDMIRVNHMPRVFSMAQAVGLIEKLKRAVVGR